MSTHVLDVWRIDNLSLLCLKKNTRLTKVYAGTAQPFWEEPTVPSFEESWRSGIGGSLRGVQKLMSSVDSYLIDWFSSRVLLIGMNLSKITDFKSKSLSLTIRFIKHFHWFKLLLIDWMGSGGYLLPCYYGYRTIWVFLGVWNLFCILITSDSLLQLSVLFSCLWHIHINKYISYIRLDFVGV